MTDVTDTVTNGLEHKLFDITLYVIKIIFNSKIIMNDWLLPCLFRLDYLGVCLSLFSFHNVSYAYFENDKNVLRRLDVKKISYLDALVYIGH